ncbi:Fic family protein [Rhodococcus erythropolis]|uniref:Fic/DOC family protein n=1 Tax=Rhodococcus erythropolis TaxID=1833 RepID=UPI00294A4126|nr:Fic family protein [Rhodococcus erythropolis]MDV6278620.1 Fic family protein [Rhodococcus erythropolis]
MSNGYHYPGTTVLRNRLGYADPHVLAQAESLIAATRMAALASNSIDCRFDFAYLQAIHRRLLGDLYEWAGNIRTIDTAPGDLGIFRDLPAAIPGTLDRVFTDINSGVCLNRHSHENFVHDVAGHWGDLTSVHPFVDGNSRAQRVFFDQLARDSGGPSNGANSASTPSELPVTSPTSMAARSSPTSCGPWSSVTEVPRTPLPTYPAAAP